jgi:hypothetical protein
MKQAQEIQEKLMAVLMSSDVPQLSVTLTEHPLLKSLHLTPRSIGAHLNSLRRNKQVKQNKHKAWSPIRMREVSEIVAEKPKLAYVLNTIDRTIQLEIGGVRLPLIIEP